MNPPSIIDVHGHLAHRPVDLDRVVENSPIKQAWLHDISCYLKLREVESAEPREILEVARRYRGFFIPFGFLDFNQPPDIVDRLKDQGFVGLKAIRPIHPYDDERYFPHYERAEKLRMPILFHTGLVSGATREMLAPGISTNSSRMRPAYLMGIAAAFPRLQLIAAHLGFPWGEEAYRAIGSFPNLYADLSGGMTPSKIEWIGQYLHRGIGHKVLMGIDATYGRKQYHLDMFDAITFWELYFEFVLRGTDAYRHKDAIFRENARKFLGACGSKKR